MSFLLVWQHPQSCWGRGLIYLFILKKNLGCWSFPLCAILLLLCFFRTQLLSCQTCMRTCTHCLLNTKAYTHRAVFVRGEYSSGAFINILFLDLNCLQMENSLRTVNLPSRHPWCRQAQRKAAPNLKAPACHLEVCSSQPALRKYTFSPRKGGPATLLCPRICSLFWPGDSQLAPSLEVNPRSNKAGDYRGG